MSVENKRLLQALHNVKAGSTRINFSDIENPLDRSKHERFLREILILDAIFPTPQDVPGFDPEISPYVELQCKELFLKLNQKIMIAFQNSEDLQRLAEQAAVYFRARDKRNVIRHGASKTMESILAQTLSEGIRDTRALALTQMEHDKTFQMTGYPVLVWFANLHGKHEPEIMKHMGGNFEKPVSLNSTFFSTKKGLRINEETLQDKLDFLSPAITSTLGCPAMYTSLFPGLWKSITDIYSNSTDAAPESK